MIDVWEDGEIVQKPDDWLIREPIVEPEIDLIAYVAKKRWEVETGGISVGGMNVHTDDRSKSLILGARMAAENDPDFSTEWKGADGQFITIDAPTIIAVSNAILAHVQNCFAIEAATITEIENGTITTTKQIDQEFEL